MSTISSSLDKLFGITPGGDIDFSDMSRCEHMPNLGRGTFNIGRKYPKEHRQAISEGVKANHHRCDGEYNSRAKRWRIVYFDGHTEDVKSLKSWGRERGYSEGGLRNIIKGKNPRGISGYKKLIKEVIEL